MHHRALAVLPWAYLLAFSSGGLQLPLTSAAMQYVGFPMTAVGVMWAARSLLAIFGPAMWGALADRRGDSRPFAIASLLIGTVLLFVLPHTTSIFWATVVFGIYGLFAGPSGSLIDGLTLTALGPEKERFGRYRAFGTLGFGITAFGSALLLEWDVIEPSPHVVFTAAGVLTLVGGIALFFVPSMPRPKLGRIRDALPMLKRRDFLMMFIVATLLWASHIGYASFVTPLATASGLPEWAIGASLASAIVVEFIMLRESQRLIARFGGPRIIVFVTGLTVIRWILVAFTTDPVIFILLHALHGLTFGLFFGTLVSLIATKVPDQVRQSAQGLVGSSSFGLGGALGSLIAGTMLEHTNPTMTWLAMAVVASVAFGCAILAFRR